MKSLKGLIALVVAFAMLAVPAGALAKQRDHNHDRIPDKWEAKYHLSTRVNVARKDPDKDGLSNLSEFRHGTDPRDADTDNDGVNDGNEVREGTNPKDADSDNDGIKDGQEDADHDGLDNQNEQEVGDNPADNDTDNDGVEDGDEVSGMVASFDGTTLTIQLPGAGAGTFSGTVDNSTVFECENEGDNGPTATMSDHGGSDDGGSDNSGPGSTSSGPGSGDDNGGDNGQQAPCSSADLTQGAVIHEAKFTTDANGAHTFTKIEIQK